MLYAKLSHHLLKKDHHYKKQFLGNHAYYCQYFIRLGWAGPAGHLGQPELIGIFPKCYKRFILDCEKFPNHIIDYNVVLF